MNPRPYQAREQPEPSSSEDKSNHKENILTKLVGGLRQGTGGRIAGKQFPLTLTQFQETTIAKLDELKTQVQDGATHKLDEVKVQLQEIVGKLDGLKVMGDDAIRGFGQQTETMQESLKQLTLKLDELRANIPSQSINIIVATSLVLIRKYGPKAATIFLPGYLACLAILILEIADESGLLQDVLQNLNDDPTPIADLEPVQPQLVSQEAQG